MPETDKIDDLMDLCDYCQDHLDHLREGITLTVQESADSIEHNNSSLAAITRLRWRLAQLESEILVLTPPELEVRHAHP